jgi:hypothetical protein
VTDDGNRKDGADAMALKQGDLGPLRSDVARRLLASRVPARFAYIALDGTPRVLSTWFHWTGKVLATSRPGRGETRTGGLNAPAHSSDEHFD